MAKSTPIPPLFPVELREKYPDEPADRWVYRSSSWIHRTTEVAKGVRIGCNSMLGPCVSIRKGVRIAPSVRIGRNATIGARTVIGNGVDIGDYADIGSLCDIGNDTKIHRYVDLEDHVSIGACACIEERALVFSHVKIGDYAKIGKQSDINTGARVRQDTHLPAKSRLAAWSEWGIAPPLITGSGHYLIRVTGPDTIMIGCTERTITGWKRSYKRDAAKVRWGEERIAEYREYFEFLVRWLEIHKDKVCRVDKPAPKKKPKAKAKKKTAG